MTSGTQGNLLAAAWLQFLSSWGFPKIRGTVKRWIQGKNRDYIRATKSAFI